MEPLLTMEETCRVLGGLHINTVQRMLLRGEIPSVMVGRRRMIDPRDVRAYIESRKTNGPAGTGPFEGATAEMSSGYDPA